MYCITTGSLLMFQAALCSISILASTNMQRQEQFISAILRTNGKRRGFQHFCEHEMDEQIESANFSITNVALADSCRTNLLSALVCLVHLRSGRQPITCTD